MPKTVARRPGGIRRMNGLFCVDEIVKGYYNHAVND